MADLIQFPFVRLQYPVIGNPLFIGDIVAADQQMLSALTAIAGLSLTDFAIFSGLDYNQNVSGPNTYNPGVFYLNGVWYYMPNGFNEDSYLQPNITQIMPKVFASDSSTHNIYQVNYAQASLIAGGSPQFVGNMNAYRMGLKTLLQNISNLTLLTTLQNVQVALFSGTYSINFTNDKAIFFAATSGTSYFLNLNMSGAVPGTVVTVKFSMGAGCTLTLTATGNLYKESGDLTNVSNNTNIMNFLYVGKNELGNDETRFNISQV